ncbi:MAG: threonine ammonia-lyase, biosynthetic [Candidatus Lambdaproteobacteria bacterium]|nr:threonine ammonia-lyase, biosynthetic [Candidatus Lambdaproteobacteria bacterium]
MDNLFKQVLTARVYDVAEHTDLDLAGNISKQLENNVFLKREDLQPVFSFKIRGAFNRIFHLTAKQQAAGVICASAGNHAQGVALSAAHLGLSALVVMPKTTPRIKVRAVERLGAEVVLEGDSFSEAAAHCEALLRKTGRTFIHPFNDPLVIAGQGTIAHELLEQCPEMQMVFVPIGGGGLISGIGGFLKAIQPAVRVVGVQPEDSNAMALSLAAGRRVALKDVGLFADGVAVKQVGDRTFALARQCVDDIVTVTTDETCSAIKAIYEDTRSIMEPAGALAVAGLRKTVQRQGLRGRNLVAINSGANMNFDRLAFVAERTQIGERREALFAVTIPERPGAMKFFCKEMVGERNVTEFNYRLMGRNEAHIFVGVGINSESERQAFSRALREHGFPHVDLTDNELAKTHVRHMVGGKSEVSAHEVLYRFEFPERPTALLDFLMAMSENWNISLFHYRMHGADFGRVLVGFEIPHGERTAFKRFLDGLKYAYQEETHNPAYSLFL